MGVTFEEGKEQIAKLASYFRTNKTTFLAYKEADARQTLIDPLFMALGWDVRNDGRTAPQYREVIPEESLEIEGHRRAPDYTFRVGQTAKFHAEAKRPSANVKDDPASAYQLRRYSWSAKLPFSILTNFAEFAVYDCRIRPASSDKAGKARFWYYTCDEYADRWREIWDVFSREAVWSGSFDYFTESRRGKRGTSEVDSEFLKVIEGWRDLLARNISLRNPNISTRDLNFAVQRTIDRVVFLRICEDRGIEPYGTLQGLTNGPAIYRRLGELFHRADDRYNSGLFYFTGERDRDEPPDEMTLGLMIDDKPLKDILLGLYYPDSPYEFSVLPAEILGQVYEQFLGKVIRLTPGGQAKVEEKTEVRKAGGVYYTPAYIVDYIVANTVGQSLQGKTPKEAARLRVVDPACGSGSFLIGAYQYLLDWHLDRYVESDPARLAGGRSPALYQGAGGQWRLTASEKKRILLNNIYGVDIDSQAVEVTKLSLLLKVLEGESAETITSQLRFLHERALPDLAGNIKCGNSLIGPDFYNGRQLSLLDEQERYRINVFDWQAEFPQIFKAGGFDAVIGNPPYVSIQTMNEAGRDDVRYFNSRYSTAGKGSYDLYVVFVERALTLLGEQGAVGFILPSKFFATDYGEPLRRLLSSRGALSGVVDFRDGQVFAQAATYTCLLFLSRKAKTALRYSLATPPETIRNGALPGFSVDSATLSESPWVFSSPSHCDLLAKLRENAVRLLDLPGKMSRGSSTGADDVFMLQAQGGRFATRDGDGVDIERQVLRTPVYATDFGRYRFSPHADERVVFPYIVSPDGYRELDEEELAEEYPNAYAYLKSRKRELLKRKQFKKWYEFSAPRNLDLHRNAQLMVPLLANTGSYCALPKSMSRYCPMASGGFTIAVSGRQPLSPLYVLGALNSRVLFWTLRKISNIFRGGWITCTKQYVGTLPIRKIDLSSRGDKSRHDQTVDLVGAILGLNQQLAAARTAGDKTMIQRQIDATDRQIDRLVYDLYELTDKEIAIVEEGGNR